MKLQLPNEITLFDVDVNENGSALFFLATPWGRDILALGPGDDLLGRFHKLLEDTMKERGIPKDASKKIKKADEAKDKRLGIKEGSKRDLAEDRKLLKKMGYKKGGK